MHRRGHVNRLTIKISTKSGDLMVIIVAQNLACGNVSLCPGPGEAEKSEELAYSLEPNMPLSDIPNDGLS
jgi:hypothetical protein